MNHDSTSSLSAITRRIALAGLGAAGIGLALAAVRPAAAQESTPAPSAATPATTTGAVTDVEGFDRGTGTGEPTEPVAHLLRLMKRADDGYNSRDWADFLDKLHSPDVVAHFIGAPSTIGRAPHRASMEMFIDAFPDIRVHNNPYDVQFGQGEWTVPMGKLSGTFTQPLTLPNGMVIEPTGKSFLMFFTTIARWQNEQIVDEYVLLDQQEMMAQVGVGQ